VKTRRGFAARTRSALDVAFAIVDVPPSAMSPVPTITSPTSTAADGVDAVVGDGAADDE